MRAVLRGVRYCGFSGCVDWCLASDISKKRVVLAFQSKVIQFFGLLET
jgi:hypothetical protein